MESEQLAAAKSIQRQTGQTFHLATRLLPERVRHPTYVLYGFFRIADEVVDDPAGRSPDDQLERLETIRAQALSDEPTRDPVLSAFQTVRNRYEIPDREVHAFIDAMAADVTQNRYSTREELDDYMRGSAAAVGAMMTAIIEPDDVEVALSHAQRLGEAFQLTNFLRDVREDVLERDRIYVPEEVLETYGTDHGAIERLEFSPAVKRAIRDELRRTEGRYHEGVAGIRYLPKDCQFAIVLAAVLYAEHHRLIRARGYDVLSTRPSLSRYRMLSCLARTWWLWRWNDDPVAVFERASAVPSEGREEPTSPGSWLPTR